MKEINYKGKKWECVYIGAEKPLEQIEIKILDYMYEEFKKNGITKFDNRRIANALKGECINPKEVNERILKISMTNFKIEFRPISGEENFIGTVRPLIDLKIHWEKVNDEITLYYEFDGLPFYFLCKEEPYQNMILEYFEKKVNNWRVS